MNKSRREVIYGPWERDAKKHNEIRRAYKFKNFAGPGSISNVTLRCRLTLKETVIEPFVYLVFDPYLVEQTVTGAAIFGLSDELLDSRVLPVKVEAAATGISFVLFDASDSPYLVDLLLRGCELHLNLITEHESIAKLPLHNDETFSVEYGSLEAALSDGCKVIPSRTGFSVNEFVVYPAHGVGQILAIEEQGIAGAKLELFVINFIKDNMTLRVPTAKIANVGMRKLSSLEQVDQAFDILKLKPVHRNQTWSTVAEEFEAKINSGDIAAIAEVVRDLYRSEPQPAQSYSERRLYEAALDRLSREIATVRHVTEIEVIEEVTASLSGRPGIAPRTPLSEPSEANVVKNDIEESTFKNERISGSEARHQFVAPSSSRDDKSIGTRAREVAGFFAGLYVIIGALHSVLFSLAISRADCVAPTKWIVSVFCNTGTGTSHFIAVVGWPLYWL